MIRQDAIVPNEWCERCSSGRLLPIAKATGKPISWFFAEIEKEADPSTDILTRMLNAPHGIEIAKSFLKIDSNEHRVTIARVVAAMEA